jgi:3-hydroxybutyryl-CoA dehydratase
VIPAVGATLGPWQIASVSAEHMRTIAVILDDPNQIHLDADVVRRLGLGDSVINQGPANLGYVMTMLREALPGSELLDVRVRFLANVFGGDSIRVAAEVTGIRRQSERTVLDCAIWLEVDGRGRALEGTAALALAADAD